MSDKLSDIFKLPYPPSPDMKRYDLKNGQTIFNGAIFVKKN